MIKIEVTEEVRRIKYRAKNGTEQSFEVQVCYAHLAGNKYPVKTEVGVPRDGAPYVPGVYVLAPESIEVDERGRLAIFPKLRAAAPAKAA